LDENQMTHNNIQLSSVLIDEDQNIKLSKFGFGFETVIELLNENEDYFAPEVYETEQFTHQSDVYAFGVLILKLMGIEVSLKLSQFLKNFDDLENLVKMVNPEYKNMIELELIVDCLRLDTKSRPFAKDLYRFWTVLNEELKRNQVVLESTASFEEEEEDLFDDSDISSSSDLQQNQQQNLDIDPTISQSFFLSSAPLPRRSRISDQKEKEESKMEEKKEKKIQIQPKEELFQRSTKKSISSSFKKGFMKTQTTFSSIRLPNISPILIKSFILDSKNKEMIISASFDYLCFTAASEFQDDIKFKQWKEFIIQLKPIIEENQISKPLQTQYQTISKIMDLKFKTEIIEKLTKISKSKKIVIKKSFGFKIFAQNISPIFRKLKLKDSEKEELSEKQKD
jgi:hypothetical protein